jgi:hypothetical protein
MSEEGSEHHDSGGSSDALKRQIAVLEAENRRLRDLLGLTERAETAGAWEPTLFSERAGSIQCVTRASSPEAKVGLFRAVFRGRHDVYALGWENPRTGKSGWSPAVKGGWVNARRADREYLPLVDAVVSAHLGRRRHRRRTPQPTPHRRAKPTDHLPRTARTSQCRDNAGTRPGPA